jgi:hypothetical protein
VDTKLDDLAAKQAAATRIAEQETATSAALAAEYARLVAARDAAKAAVESANNWEELDAILDAPTDDKPSK